MAMQYLLTALRLREPQVQRREQIRSALAIWMLIARRIIGNTRTRSKAIISSMPVTLCILGIVTHTDVFSKVSRDSTLVQMVQSHPQPVHQVQWKTKTPLMHSLVVLKLGQFLIGRFTSTLNTEPRITYSPASATTITQTSAQRVVIHQGKISPSMLR